MTTIMSTKLKTLACIALLLIAGVALLLRTASTYSMKTAREYEINARTASKKVLIATQGSDYKDAVVSGIVEFLKAEAVHLKVIDISSLSDSPMEWDAIIILHTWEFSRPPAAVEQFLQSYGAPDEVIVVTTSTYGNEKIENVDGITSASRIEDVTTDVQAITARLEEIID